MIRRRLFTILSALSLLLCAATCVLWVRSYWRGDEVQRFTKYPEGRDESLFLGSVRGRLWYMRERVGPGLGDTRSSAEWYPPVDRGPSHPWASLSFAVKTDVDTTSFASVAPRRVLGIRYGRSLVWGGRNMRWGSGEAADIRCFVIPHAYVVVLTGVAPLAWLRCNYRSRYIRTLGLCPACGYDLRATPDRCPECGATPKGASA